MHLYPSPSLLRKEQQLEVIGTLTKNNQITSIRSFEVVASTQLVFLIAGYFLHRSPYQEMAFEPFCQLFALHVHKETFIF
jgi:hypothetical protein